MMARVVTHEGAVSLDQEQLTQLQAVALHGDTHGLSAPMAQALRALVEQLLAGEPVTVYPADLELSMDQAAELFDLVPAKLEQRLDEGEIPFIERDGQRYVSVRAMIDYDQAEHATRQRWLDVLLETSQELGAYERPPSAAQER
jgi:hypothetical protein